MNRKMSIFTTEKFENEDYVMDMREIITKFKIILIVIVSIIGLAAFFLLRELLRFKA